METPPEDHRKYTGIYVTRGQLAVILAVLLIVYTIITSRDEARITRVEQESRDRTERDIRLQEGIDKIDHDFKLLMDMVVTSKKVEP